MKKVAVALVVLVVLALGAGAGAWMWLERGISTPAGAADSPTLVFTVPRGTSARGLGNLLLQQGVISDATHWRYFLWKRGGLQAKAGRHELSARMTMAELATSLEGAPIPEDEPFTVVEGWRLRDTDAALVMKGWISPGQYIAAASRPERFRAQFPLPRTTLEGYLYPETYRANPKDFDVEKFIQRQLDTFGDRFHVPFKDEIAQSGRTLDALVVMASMLEREEPVPAQRPLVAGILWKRIDRGVALGVDATSRYELDEWNDRRAFLKRLRDPNDAYNTRMKVGLPPGPIGAPTVDSLVAALRPVKSEYWYYLHDANKVLHPSRNAREHEALRTKYNVW
jgi:UPF0755 protein